MTDPQISVLSVSISFVVIAAILGILCYFRIVTRSIISIISVVLFVCCIAGGVVALVALRKPPPAPVSAACVPGNISVEGSSAFYAATEDIAQHYMGMCPKSMITVIILDSREALRDLAAAGPPNPKSGSGIITIAMSDVPPQDVSPALVGQKVGILLFSVVVNSDVGIRSLTLKKIQDIYGGDIQNWHDLGRPREPITVVARERTSGTRYVFNKTVLNFAREMGRATFVTSTSEMLMYVGDHPGSIGYAATASASSGSFPNITRLRLKGVTASLGAVQDGRYPFWGVEYFTTYGQPPLGSLQAAFLRYMTSDTSNRILHEFRLVSCQDAEGGMLALCENA